MVEILMVVAIVSVLTSMLMPAFAKSKDEAKRLACANNLRQISLALIQYSEDHNGVLPNKTVSGQIDGIFWSLISQHYITGTDFKNLGCNSYSKTGLTTFGVPPYNYVMGDSNGQGGLSIVNADEWQPILTDARTNWVGNGTGSYQDMLWSANRTQWISSQYFVKASHKNGGNMFYANGTMAFQKTFYCGVNGGQGYLQPPNYP